MRPGAHGDQCVGETDFAVVAIVRCQADLVGAEKFHRRARAFDRVAHELVLQHLDLMVERLVQALDQVADRDILLDPIAASIEAALAPAREIEHRFAQRFGRNGAGVHRDAAKAPAPVDHQHRFAEFGRLHCGAAAGRAAADDQHVVVHIAPSPRRLVAPQQANAIRAANSTASDPQPILSRLAPRRNGPILIPP